MTDDQDKRVDPSRPEETMNSDLEATQRETPPESDELTTQDLTSTHESRVTQDLAATQNLDHSFAIDDDLGGGDSTQFVEQDAEENSPVATRAEPPNPPAASKAKRKSNKPHEMRDKVPGFRIVEELGRGAFGVVYRAQDISLDRHVAIKLPLLHDKKLAEKYVLEAKNAAKLDTFGIVPVFQVGTTRAGQPFVVQKLIEGSALDSILKQHGTLNAGDALTVIYQIAKAMSQAHLAGLVHRDLKPANVLIDTNGNPWVADFGLAVFEEDQAELKGEIAGTPAYMAPEQLGHRADWLDGRADIWAIGIMLYELLVGKPPFTGKNFADLKEQILNRQPRPISQRLPGIPMELDAIFSRCCAKKVDDRYASASQLIEDLEKLSIDTSLQLQLETPSNLGSGPSTLLSQVGSSAQLRRSTYGSTISNAGSGTPGLRWIGLAVGLIAVAGTIGFAVVWSQLNPPEDPGNVTSAPGAEASAPTTETLAPIQLLRVSKTGDGSHTTIAEALAAAKEGDEIKIAPGVYRENLQLSTKIVLVGEGAREDVRILGVDASAVSIDAGDVKLVNLTIDTDGEELNSVEVVSGKLALKGCLVLASSYDCVKLHANTEAVIENTDFRSGEHPAIVAKNTRSLTVANCDFRFDLPNIGIDREEPIVAIELTECGAVINECMFTGIDQLGKGISCRDTAQKLTVSKCTFSGLLHGVELFNTSDFELISDNTISNCELGIYAENSRGLLENVMVTNCVYGLIALGKSEFSIMNSGFESNKRVGLWLDDSQLDMEQSRVRDNQTAGILIDAATGETPHSIRGCELTKNQIGLLLVDGRTEFELGTVSLNLGAGVAVLSFDQLPEALRRRPRDAQGMREIYAKRVSINGKVNAPAITFNAPGTYELIDCPYVDVPNSNRPAIVPGLTTEQRETITRVKRK